MLSALIRVTSDAEAAAAAATAAEAAAAAAATDKRTDWGGWGGGRSRDRQDKWNGGKWGAGTNKGAEATALSSELTRSAALAHEVRSRESVVPSLCLSLSLNPTPSLLPSLSL